MTCKGSPRDHTQEDPCALTPEVNSAHTQEVQRDQARESLRALIKGIPTCPRTRRATCPRVDRQSSLALGRGDLSCGSVDYITEVIFLV